MLLSVRINRVTSTTASPNHAACIKVARYITLTRLIVMRLHMDSHPQRYADRVGLDKIDLSA